MHYLIDGHNLIARVPGLSLADPDDEVKLLQLLKRCLLYTSDAADEEVTVAFPGIGIKRLAAAFAKLEILG